MKAPWNGCLVDQIGALPLVEDLPVLLARLFDGDPDAAPFFAHTSYDEHDEQILSFAP